MAGQPSDVEILETIQNTYVPFLKKLLAHLEKKKGAQPKSFEKLKYVQQTFTEGDSKEKIEVYNACKDMLERWHKRYKDMKGKGTEKKPETAAVVSEDSQSETSISSSQKSSSTSILSIVSVRSYSSVPSQPVSVSQKDVTERQDGVYIQDEIEIESADSSILPVSVDKQPEKWKPILNIKKEKEDGFPSPASPQVRSTSQVPVTKNQSLPLVCAAASNAVQAATNSTEQNTNNADPDKVVFVCASCQFRTTDETDFMKHARTDHRTDLSLWCKQCGKCFSNAGVLVAHIKENNCQKEDMIYRCGVKECTFETPSGQTFVHHLRHCHKGSPFIFCIHCQKIFTLPHCLILHMQNECPFKEKNRKNPGEYVPPTPTPTPPPSPKIPVVPVVKPAVEKLPPPVRTNPTPVVSATPKPVTPVIATPSPQNSSSTMRRGVSINRSRSRGKGRVGRARFSDSSESDDPDDPSWKPEESLNSQPLRRSARWAKKVSDAKNPDLYDSDSSSSKNKTLAEQPGETFFNCPCCDFTALFKSLMNDHFITDHKNPKRNSCLVCNVKFESVQLFLEHFPSHENDKGNETVAEAPPVAAAPLPPPPVPPAIQSKSNSEASKVGEKRKQSDIHMETVSGSQTKVVVEREKSNSVVKIPYQTAIHEKVQKDSKVKSFEELKSPTDIQKMKTDTKLKHFFKCVVYGCTFTTDDNGFYASHLAEHHKGKKLYCAYCLSEIPGAQQLADHMLNEHGRRCYQCSLCFYRGSSKPHVQIHIKNSHTADKAHVYTCSTHLPPSYSFKEDEEDSDLTTTWPYVCAIGDCKFQTYDPKEFKKHNDVTHRSVSVFFCYYCKVDFISLKRLMSHYHLHGINNYQCTYCVHGSDTREEILLHLCNCHADKPFKVHVRAPQESDTTVKRSCQSDASADGKGSERILGPTPAKVSRTNVNVSAEKAPEKHPQEIACFERDFFCHLAFCDREFAQIQLYLGHLIDDHGAANFLCPYCSKMLDDILSFKNHVLCHGPNLYACVVDTCLWHSWDESTVVEHVKSTHKLKDATVQVVRQKSDYVLKPDDLLNISGLTETSSVTDTYICLFCYYKTKHLAALKNHMYLELNYRRFVCNLCKAKCCSRKETEDHYSLCHSHHNIKCVFDVNSELEHLVKCSLRPEVQKILREYVLQEDSTSNSVTAKFSCFSSAYVCECCSSTFTRIRELSSHLLLCLYKEYLPYHCNQCDVKTADLLSMKSHINAVHTNSKIEYATFKNQLLEEQLGRKLQQIRLNFLGNIMMSLMGEASQFSENHKPVDKFYKCVYCKFSDSFRTNIERHIQGCHKNKTVKVIKVSGDSNAVVSLNDNSNSNSPSPLQQETNEASSLIAGDKTKRYLCSFCTKKTYSLEELEGHIDGHHVQKDKGTYPFFYWPDPGFDYSVNDTVLYECAYCSVSQENLYHLRRHCNNLHSEVPFKVRGLKSKDCSLIQCNYCDYKVMSYELLERHCRFNHPKKGAKAAGGTSKQGTKRKLESDDVGKTSKTEEKFQCSYCSEQFKSYTKLSLHSQATHPHTSLKFEKIQPGKEFSSISLLPCSICSFVGEKKLLLKHLTLKHKNCVGCGHCQKYFESMPKLEEHNSKEHKGQPLITVMVDSAPLLQPDSEASLTYPEGEPFSYYGKKPEPFNLDSITVNLETKDSGVNTKLPVVYLTKMFKMFPKVVLHDIYKS